MSGRVPMGHGDREEALRLWNQAVDDNPDKWQAYCCRADRLKKLGMAEEAMADYEYCFAMQSAPRITDGLYSLARMHESRGEYTAAIGDYRCILRCYEEEHGGAPEPEREQIEAEIKRPGGSILQ